MIFKIFNKIETWELLTNLLGNIKYSEYQFETYDHILCRAMKRGESIYSGAYIMPSGNSSFGFSKKHSNHLKLIELMMKEEFPNHIMQSCSMQKVFDLLSFPTLSGRGRVVSDFDIVAPINGRK